ncbi:MAG: protein phosphatase 2C domain-containing protein [Candidatus Aenigmarchaeota archaeon]|nr:protein phosphatase 2C domain-containing protein [Candidatus Aenigmarchaeota archaeon]
MKIDFIVDEGSSKEDAYLIKDNIFGVFDGFNSLDKFIGNDDKTGGLIAATIARNIFSRNGKDLSDLAVEANQKIKEKIQESNIDINKKSRLWGTMFAVVRIKEDSFEWAQIGDSLILVIYKDRSFKLLVSDYDHDKEVLKIWKELANRKKENIRTLIDKGPLLELRNKMNADYGCLTGEDEAIKFLKSGIEKLKTIKHILIFTDGIIIPKENPSEEDNWRVFVKLFLEGGLKNIRDFVRNLEKDDPKCWRYPRYKQYDDITAISISF